MKTIHRHLAPACMTLLLVLTSSAASLTATNSAKKTYIVGLKDTAWKPTREELANGASPVQYYLLNHNLYVPEENKLHFLNEFIIDLDDTEYAALFNREWTGTEIQDAHGRTLHRRARQAGKALTKAEIDALYHPAKGTRAVHTFQNLSAIDEDIATVKLCALWPTNGFPTRSSVADPTLQQVIGVGLQRMNVGTTNGFLPWATSPFPVPYINGQFKPLCYPGTTNRIGVAVLDSGIDAYLAQINSNGSVQDYRHPDLEVIPYISGCANPSSPSCTNNHSFRSFNYAGVPEYADIGDGNGHGHGTAVASVIAAMDNGYGIVGIAPDVEIWNVRCVGTGVYSTWSNIHKGMNYVIYNADKIAVANMSFVNEGSITTGSGSTYAQLQSDIQKMVQAGVVLVAAAGNDKMDIRGADGIYGTGDDKYPAAFSEVISVSGMDAHTGTFYGYNPTNLTTDGSNFGPVARPAPASGLTVYTGPGQGIDLAAPAVNVEVAATFIGTNSQQTPDDPTIRSYSYANSGVRGTSFAAPHVTGLVALYIAAHSRATNEQGVYDIRKAIMQESEHLQPQTDWGVTNTFDPDTAHEALAFTSEAWIPQPTPSWQFNRASNTLHAAVIATNATVAATVRGYDYKLVYQDALGGPGWSNYPGASQPGTGSPVDLGTVSTLETSDRFFTVQRVPTPVP